MLSCFKYFTENSLNRQTIKQQEYSKIHFYYFSKAIKLLYQYGKD